MLFEQLVGDLLKLEYPGLKFIRTKASYDGSRDWETEVPVFGDLKAEIWFECKYYKEKLPAHAIAMTLVMAYAENARQIVFFSYSPINREFPKKVAAFAERARIPTKIYDDNALEALILKHWKVLNVSKYFPDIIPADKGHDCREITAYCDVRKNGKTVSCSDRRNMPVIRFNDEITLNFTFLSHDINNAHVIKVWFEPKDYEYFDICTTVAGSKKQPHSIHVKHNELVLFPVIVKLRKFAPRVSLPTLHFAWGDQTGKINPGCVEGQWLAETDLIGQSFLDVLTTQKELMRCSTFTISEIVGTSGVGKSRLLHEIALQGRLKNKYVFQLDADWDSVDYAAFVRKIVSELEEMPLFPRTKGIHISCDTSQEKVFALRILYEDGYIDTLSVQQLADYLFVRMSDRRLWVVLDNVQWLDERILDLLNALLSYAGKPSDAGVVLSFNLDYLYSGTSPYKLKNEIQAHNSQKPDVFFFTHLRGFTYHDALAYLRECLSFGANDHINQGDYAQTLTKIIDHCGTQPFFLQNMLIYLSQCHVLERTDKTCFYIVSISEFWKHIREIPKSVSALLEKRIQAAAAHFAAHGSEEMFWQLCQILSFTGSLPFPLYRELFPDTSIRRQLMEIGIISTSGDDSLSFYHQYFEQYFQEKFPLAEIPATLLQRFCNAVEARHYTTSMIEPYYLAHYALNTCTPEMLTQVMNYIAAGRVSPRFNRRMNCAAACQLQDISEQISGELVAKCYAAICYLTAKRDGMKLACTYYAQCYQDMIQGEKHYTEYRDIIFPMLREYFLSLGNINHNMQAIALAEAFLPYCKTKEEESVIYEILCISNYATGHTEEAETAIKKALACVPYNSLEYLRYIREYGRIYYYHKNAFVYRDLISEKWHHAFSAYMEEWKDRANLEETNSLQTEIAIYLDAGIADLISGNVAQAKKKADYLSTFLNRTHMPYYESKIRLFRALTLLMNDIEQRGYGNSYNEIYTLLGQAADHCVIYYNMQDYPTCIYLQASAQLASGRNSEAIDSYKRAARIITENSDSPEEEYFWIYFFEDMALRFAQMRTEFPSDLLSRIKSRDVKENIKQLCSSKDPDIQITQCDRSPILFYPGPWGLPKV